MVPRPHAELKLRFLVNSYMKRPLMLSTEPSSSEQMDNSPVRQEIYAGRRSPFQSPGKFPPKTRFNINSQYVTAEKISDEQEPRRSTALRLISGTTSDPKLAPSSRTSIGEMAPALNIGQQQQKPSQGFYGQRDERRGYPSGYGGERRVRVQDVRSRQDNDHSQGEVSIGGIVFQGCSLLWL